MIDKDETETNYWNGYSKNSVAISFFGGTKSIFVYYTSRLNIENSEAMNVNKRGSKTYGEDGRTTLAPRILHDNNTKAARWGPSNRSSHFQES